VQLRTPTHGRAYYDRKTASGKGSMEAMRCLQPRLSDIVFRTMLADLAAASVTGPGGQRGDDSHSSAAGPRPHTGISDKPLSRTRHHQDYDRPRSNRLTQKGAM
jgi:transposase